ncbi:MAG TPA: Rid family detoxifying hydrolase [Microvirga sp.]|jgi:2-iminobutanoate/2-iminopropanoate deaminase|nr:Rid family detoxifying hydrolase [Microvirga sp.]
MTRDAILTSDAPKPLGPYSQAVRAGGVVHVAGQLPLAPGGGLVGRGDIREQTRAVFANIAAILDAAGSSLDRVVKTTVFLTSLDDFPGMNDVYAATFQAPYPARSTVEIGRLPDGMLLEIECIATL